MTEAAVAPGPKNNVLFQMDSSARKNTHLFFCHLEKKYGDVSRVRFGHFRVVVLSHPEYIEYMFLSRKRYVKIQQGGMLRHLLGKGLLTNEGDFWLKQRKLIQPIFHHKRLNSFTEKMIESIEGMMKSWERQSGETINVYSEMNRLTLDIVGKTLFSTNIQDNFSKVSRALTSILTSMRNRNRLMQFPLWVPTPAHLNILYNRRLLDQTILEIIRQRRESVDKYDDLLTMLMEVEDSETAERMSDRQLRDEALTLFIAGHETTANALAFTLYLLAKHPEVKQKVVREINEVLGGQPISFGHLHQLTYLTQVINESLRLYPPAWVIPREATEDDVIGGYQIQKGDKVMASPYAMHHSERFWEEPELFQPERFSPDRMKQVPRFAYFPFGGGQRFCVGMNFAMMEMQLTLAILLPRFELRLPDDFQLELLPLVTLRPKHGVPMVVSTK